MKDVWKEIEVQMIRKCGIEIQLIGRRDKDETGSEMWLRSLRNVKVRRKENSHILRNCEGKLHKDKTKQKYISSGNVSSIHKKGDREVLSNYGDKIMCNKPSNDNIR
jgi:hypothetical protein